MTQTKLSGGGCKETLNLDMNFFIFRFLNLSFNLSSSGMVMTRLDTFDFSTFPALYQFSVGFPANSLGQIPLDSCGAGGGC